MSAADFISIRDFSPSEIEYLLLLGRQIKAHPGAYSKALKGKTLAMIFEKPSLRTRVSFDVGIQQLGGFSLISLSRGNQPRQKGINRRRSQEPGAHGAGHYGRRTSPTRLWKTWRNMLPVPVVNGLSDYSHPCQAMADYLTMWEIKGSVDGLKVAYVGDGNNVAHSLMFAGAQLGANVWVATPPGHGPQADAVAWARERGQETGGGCWTTNDAKEAVSAADVVYTDVWTSMGQEAEAEKRQPVFRDYQVDSIGFSPAPRGTPSLCTVCPRIAGRK